MNNKQIKKNIPNYRKQTPKSNYNFIFNSYTFDRNKNFQKYKNHVIIIFAYYLLAF